MKKLKIIGFSLLISFILFIGFSIVAYFRIIEPYLPNTSSIREVSLSEPMKIYSKEGLVLSEIGIRRRYLVEFDEIPKDLINSLLIIEDNRFYDHFGVDFLGLFRAFIELVKTGQKNQGASTLTMQLARNLFLTREKSFIRKFREIFLAFRLENVYSKNEILTLYINRVFLGHRSYGFQAAARTYFGKKLTQLTLSEQAMLAGLPKAPSAYNPLSNPTRAKQRRDYILLRLFQEGIITEERYLLAVSEPIKAKNFGASVELDAGHAASMAHHKAVKILKQQGIKEGIYEKGYKVITTLSGKNQRVANNAVQRGVLNYIRRHSWSGAEKKVAIEFENEKNWEELNLIQKNTIIKSEKNRNYLIGLTQQIPEILGLTRGIIYHSKDNQIVAILEDNQITKLPLKDISWARNTWTRETAEATKIKIISKKIKEDIEYLLLNEASGVYFHPKLISSKQSNRRQSKALPTGGIIYVKEKTEADGTSKTYTLVTKPKAQVALVSLDVRTGAINSLIGGFNYQNYKFNRVTQSNRQPGSNFKPFLYAAAFNKGFTAASIIEDIPMSFEDKSTGFIWTPSNYSGKYFGATRLREALTKSRNLVSVQLQAQIGTEYTIDYMKKFGFKRKPFVQNRNLSISLGSAALTPMEIARGYAVFANGGYLVTPYIVAEIQDSQGNTIYKHQPPVVCYEECDSLEKFIPPSPPRTLDADVSYIITNILKDVIKYGTGRRARVLNRPDIAGKTGTTNDQYDAWFSGFNRSIVTTVWVGYDNPQPMGNEETGSRAALPVWIDYMQEVLKDTPVIDFPRSNNIIELRVSKKSGKPVLNADAANNTTLEIFRSQYAPTKTKKSKTQERKLILEQQEKPIESLIKKIF
jgi:penicillin-binding protein 1A